LSDSSQVATKMSSAVGSKSQRRRRCPEPNCDKEVATSTFLKAHLIEEHHKGFTWTRGVGFKNPGENRSPTREERDWAWSVLHRVGGQRIRIGEKGIRVGGSERIVDPADHLMYSPPHLGSSMSSTSLVVRDRSPHDPNSESVQVRMVQSAARIMADVDQALLNSGSHRKSLFPRRSNPGGEAEESSEESDVEMDVFSTPSTETLTERERQVIQRRTEFKEIQTHGFFGEKEQRARDKIDYFEVYGTMEDYTTDWDRGRYPCPLQTSSRESSLGTSSGNPPQSQGFKLPEAVVTLHKNSTTEKEKGSTLKTSSTVSSITKPLGGKTVTGVKPSSTETKTTTKDSTSTPGSKTVANVNPKKTVTCGTTSTTRTIQGTTSSVSSKPMTSGVRNTLPVRPSTITSKSKDPLKSATSLPCVAMSTSSRTLGLTTLSTSSSISCSLGRSYFSPTAKRCLDQSVGSWNVNNSNGIINYILRKSGPWCAADITSELQHGILLPDVEPGWLFATVCLTIETVRRFIEKNDLMILDGQRDDNTTFLHHTLYSSVRRTDLSAIIENPMGTCDEKEGAWSFHTSCYVIKKILEHSCPWEASQLTLELVRSGHSLGGEGHTFGMVRHALATLIRLSKQNQIYLLSSRVPRGKYVICSRLMTCIAEADIEPVIDVQDPLSG